MNSVAVIPKLYLDCVFYLYPSRDAAERGERAGGSGFLVARRFGQDDQVFLVSNRHVIESMAEPYIRVNLRESAGTETIRIPKVWWHNHPDGDDLCAAQVDLSAERYKIAWVYEHAFMNGIILENENVGLGDSIAMLGRFSAHDGKLQNSPSVRFGHIAMIAPDPVQNKFGKLQETLVVECFSLPGYSVRLSFGIGGPMRFPIQQ